MVLLVDSLRSRPHLLALCQDPQRLQPRLVEVDKPPVPPLTGVESLAALPIRPQTHQSERLGTGPGRHPICNTSTVRKTSNPHLNEARLQLRAGFSTCSVCVFDVNEYQRDPEGVVADSGMRSSVEAPWCCRHPGFVQFIDQYGERCRSCAHHWCEILHARRSDK